MGQITEAVITRARSDIMFVKIAGQSLPRKMLLTTAVSEYAQCAEPNAAALVPNFDGVIAVCQVANKDGLDQDLTPIEERIDLAKKRILNVNGIRSDLTKRVGYSLGYGYPEGLFFNLDHVLV